MKSVRIRSFSGPYFPGISQYSVQMWENKDQKNSEYGHFLRSGSYEGIDFRQHSCERA